MPRAYSEDLRSRVVMSVVEEGLSRRAAARRYGVSDSAAIKWVAAYRASGRTRALAMGRPRGLKLERYRDFIVTYMTDQDATLDALQAALLEECGLYASRTLVWRYLTEQGLSHKKNAACQ